MFLSGYDILRYMAQGLLEIEPFSREIIRENGVDLRIGDEIARQKNIKPMCSSININNIGDYMIIEKCNNVIRIPSKTFILASTLEKVKLSARLIGFCCLRSTWARLGLIIPPTIIDAGFEGQLTIELYNAGSLDVDIPVGARFLHVVFAETLSPCTPYVGKYQHQKGVTLPRGD